MKGKYPYIIEPYCGDGIFECDKCHCGCIADVGYDVYAAVHYKEDAEFMGSYCNNCTAKLFTEPVLKPNKVSHSPMTYNDIIFYLSNALEKEDNEAISELDALLILEEEIHNLIALLQIESPSQTPSP